MNRLVIIILFSFFTCWATSGQGKKEMTWTFTYLQAKENQRENLKLFLQKNWFVMDSIAVQRGLFNDYKLYENVTKPDSTASWDYIVAVEYFTRETYSDIQERRAEIRKEHTKVLVDGLDFPDLGSVVRSEEVVVSR